MDMLRCHQKYGSYYQDARFTQDLIVLSGNIVRFGPDRLLMNSSTAVRGMPSSMRNEVHLDLVLTLIAIEIYDHSKPVKTSKAFATLTRILGAQSLLTIIDKSVHRRRRRVINQGFSPEMLTRFEPAMVEHVRIFCDQLLKDRSDVREGWTKMKNVKDFCERFLPWMSLVDSYLIGR